MSRKRRKRGLQLHAGWRVYCAGTGAVHSALESEVYARYDCAAEDVETLDEQQYHPLKLGSWDIDGRSRGAAYSGSVNLREIREMARELAENRGGDDPLQDATQKLLVTWVRVATVQDACARLEIAAQEDGEDWPYRSHERIHGQQETYWQEERPKWSLKPTDPECTPRMQEVLGYMGMDDWFQDLENHAGWQQGLRQAADALILCGQGADEDQHQEWTLRFNERSVGGSCWVQDIDAEYNGPEDCSAHNACVMLLEEAAKSWLEALERELLEDAGKQIEWATSLEHQITENDRFWVIDAQGNEVDEGELTSPRQRRRWEHKRRQHLMGLAQQRREEAARHQAEQQAVRRGHAAQPPHTQQAHAGEAGGRA